jgi:hypothetical protein
MFCLSLTLAGVLFFAGDAGSAKCPPAESRPVVDNVLTSRADPPVRVRVDRSLTYLGSLRFALKGVACVERHVFAASENGRIRREFIFQFEGFLDDNAEIYRWTVRNPHRLGDQDYHFNTWFFDSAKLIAKEPDTESAMTQAFLKSKGLALDAELMMARFARVVGADKRHELILFYIEPLKETGFRVADFPDGGTSTPAQKDLAEKLKQRALATFEVLP